MRAAEVAARRAADSVAGWPDGPLTEESVALVAAQALRWHGERIIGRLPFWVMGWIFVASPVFEQLLPTVPSTERNRLRREVLNRADQVRRPGGADLGGGAPGGSTVEAVLGAGRQSRRSLPRTR